MAEIEISGDGASSSLVTTAQIIYGLHSLSILIGLTSAITIVGAFVFGVPSIIAVPIMIVMMLMATRVDVMGPFAIRHRLKFLGWLATAAMGLVVLTMLVTAW